jgi:hypothetical protein
MDMVLGVLIYAVVLGFFNDYTNILTTKSYSTTFLVAIVMQLLTYGTLKLKSYVVNRFKNKDKFRHKAMMGLGIWLIMFFSKFVFLGVIDFIFGDVVEISGFIGIMMIIISVVIFIKLIDAVYEKLA